MAHERGFTLLEVLVALAVFALSAAAILRQTHLGSEQLLLLSEKSQALWIAEDRLAVVHGAPAWPPLGRVQDTVELAGQEWQVITEVQATALPQLRRVEVSVGRAGGNYQQVALTTFRGQH